MAEDGRIYIKQAAVELNRQVGTLRKWDREGVLPDDMQPERDGRDRRYWSPGQIKLIKSWMEETDRRPGKGLPHYKPDAEKIAQHLQRQRGRRNGAKLVESSRAENDD